MLDTKGIQDPLENT